MTNLWQRLSASERRLAGIVGVLAVLFALYAAALPALEYLRDLDYRIETREMEVLNMTRQAAQSYAVDTRYRRLAEQHSTSWTEAEIRDGVQRELDRLALRDPDESKSGRLVQISSRPSGSLMNYSGYREYQTTFSTSPGDIRSLTEFLRRIQESPQALRIDRLDLRRPDPRQDDVVAEFQVTRVVVDRGAEEGLEDLSPAPVVGGWTGVDCALEPLDGGIVKASATEAGALLYQVHELVAGKKLRLSVEVGADGTARLGVLNLKTGKPTGAEAPVAVGEPRAYAAEFVIPGTAGEKVALGIPCVVIEAEGTTVTAARVTLEEVP
jgi:hypothetical protein